MTSNQSQPTVETSNLENDNLSGADNLPFAFARRYGVIVNQDVNESEPGTLSLTCRATLAPSVLLEIQRYFQKTIKIQSI
ncbi:MAG: hypothetical protein KAJ39_01790, partial [Gammaproteobacteria bacterium]|nr:hypothetical protein [Gammaproteobacteria bacterium]